jgi:hypothetical protein
MMKGRRAEDFQFGCNGVQASQKPYSETASLKKLFS